MSNINIFQIFTFNMPNNINVSENGYWPGNPLNNAIRPYKDLTFSYKDIYNIGEVEKMIRDAKEQVSDLNTRLSKLVRFL